MSVLGLNCRGLGGAAAVRDLRLLAERHTPTILFVVETQLQRDRVEGLARSLGFDNSFAVSSSGRSGGIGIFWNNSIKFEILSYSQYHLDGVVTEEGKDPWRLTVVYGEAQVNERHKTWDMLKFIRSSTDLPWLCMGDFNEVLHRDEHVGVSERSWSQILGFRDTVDICGLCDLGFKGVPWTFEKKVAAEITAVYGLIVPWPLLLGAHSSLRRRCTTCRAMQHLTTYLYCWSALPGKFRNGVEICSGMRLCGSRTKVSLSILQVLGMLRRRVGTWLS
jgi:hypothetical protein